MWLMILIAVHTNNPNDIPGKVTLEFTTQQLCQQTLETLKYEMKFRSFMVEGRCEQK